MAPTPRRVVDAGGRRDHKHGQTICNGEEDWICLLESTFQVSFDLSLSERPFAVCDIFEYAHSTDVLQHTRHGPGHASLQVFHESSGTHYYKQAARCSFLSACSHGDEDCVTQTEPSFPSSRKTEHRKNRKRSGIYGAHCSHYQQLCIRFSGAQKENGTNETKETRILASTTFIPLHCKIQKKFSLFRESFEMLVERQPVEMMAFHMSQHDCMSSAMSDDSVRRNCMVYPA